MKSEDTANSNVITEDKDAKQILILGSGFGGFYTLMRLLSWTKPSDNVKITLISDENYFLFSPLLHAVAAGGIETRHTTFPIRRMKQRNKFEFIQSVVEKIDVQKRAVITNMGVFEYDFLVIALGGISNLPQIDHIVQEERKIFTLKTLYDSILIRNHIIKVFELASVKKNLACQKQLLTFVICGGGYTGIQMACELRDLINDNLLQLYHSIDQSNVRIIIVEQSDKIVRDLHPKLASYALKAVNRMGIEIKFNAQITRIWRNRVEINETDIVPTDTLIWVTGVVANPRVAELDSEKDGLGRVAVDEYLEVNNCPNVYALGDCAYLVADPQSGLAVPPRAHHAVRQAKVVAQNILAQMRGEKKKIYVYSNSGEVVFLGASRAVFRFLGVRICGRFANVLGLLGYSLLIPGGGYNRIRIIMDWLLYSIFGRDSTFIRQI